MTQFKIKDDWQDHANKKIYNYEGRKVRYMSRRDEKLLLHLIACSDYVGSGKDFSRYVYRGL